MMADSQAILSGNGDDPRTLIVVFLRGGADGLNMVAPFGDDGYRKARPRIALGREDSIKLDDFFGLNPLLGGLEGAWNRGDLAIVHAAGSEDQTRSHFEAQDLMEHGGLAAGGWLGRFLRYKDRPADAGLAAIALSKGLPESLRGAPAATAMSSINEFSLGRANSELQNSLSKLYTAQGGLLEQPARDTFRALTRIDALRNNEYEPQNGAVYSDDPFSRSLVQTARLIRARVGVEAVTLDLGGWDSHLSQGPIMNPRMTRLADGLGAFHQDMGKDFANVTVVVMSEFGRRVRENSAFGTDHGRGGVMFVMGRGVNGGKVLGEWPGLSDDVLEGPGDLPVRSNYRDVLAPVLSRHGAGELQLIFPDYRLSPLAIVS
jgi:uncharacterized protein (DUF1501 family)